MSEWYEPKKEDIDIVEDQKEVHIFVKQNDFGSVYTSLTFEQIEAIYKEIKGLATLK